MGVCKQWTGQLEWITGLTFDLKCVCNCLCKSLACYVTGQYWSYSSLESIPFGSIIP